MRLCKAIATGLTAAMMVLAATSAPAQAPTASQPAALGVALASEASGNGVQVQQVIPGLTAATIGIQPGDVIMRVNGLSVNAPDSILAIMQTMKAGAPIAVTVRREGRDIELTGVATPRPEGMRVGMQEVKSE